MHGQGWAPFPVPRGAAPYYYANDIYYAPVSNGAGYAVVAPPPGAEATSAPPVPSPGTSPQAGQAPGPAPAPASSGYYCDSAKGYYPCVAECREGWRTVPATPPR